ncbi:MAG: hypothetical protein GY719_17460 [bacterium]|nr:hypothetical protein [bacterium]
MVGVRSIVTGCSLGRAARGVLGSLRRFDRALGCCRGCERGSERSTRRGGGLERWPPPERLLGLSRLLAFGWLDREPPLRALDPERRDDELLEDAFEDDAFEDDDRALEALEPLFDCSRRGGSPAAGRAGNTRIAPSRVTIDHQDARLEALCALVARFHILLLLPRSRPVSPTPMQASNVMVT